MHVQLHCSIDEFHALTKAEKNPYVRTRLHAIAMAYERKSAQQIGALLGYSSRAIFKWVKNYNCLGKKGLLDKAGRGKPPLFSDDETKIGFCQRIQAGPTDGRSVFHGTDVQRILREEFGKLRSLSDVYYLMHNLGYEWLAPRPRHHRASQEEQEEFKKKSRKK